MASITKPQVRKIWATSKELGLDEETVYTIVYRETGCDSISSLTKEQGVDVINALVSLKEQKPLRPGMATEKQLWLISKLVKDLGWDDKPKRLQGFVKRLVKVDNPRWLTQQSASKIIIGLKAIQRQQMEKQAARESSQ